MATTSSNQESLLTPGKAVSDWGRIKHSTVGFIAHPETEEDFVSIVKFAKEKKLKISVRGIGHSATGQTFVDNGIMVDMLKYNKVLQLDEVNKTLRIQCGATWGDVTKLLEPKRLCVTTKQEFDIFSIGGSLAANAHGKSIDYAALISHVLNFRLVNADGKILEVSRKNNPEIFHAAIGGWGLFGMIIDVTLQLVDDKVIEKSEVVYMKTNDLIPAYIERINRHPEQIPLCYGFFDTTFDTGYYLTYRYLNDGKDYPLNQLKRDEQNPIFFNIFIWLQRHCSYIRKVGFGLTWAASGKPEITLRSRRLLLWDKAPKAFNDLMLQKYYIPVDKFEAFVPKAKAIFEKYKKDIKLSLLHFRYQPANNEAVLASLQERAMCFFPVYLAEKDNPKWVSVYEQVSNELVNEVLAHNGSFYLTFVPATSNQVSRAYPFWDKFVELKNKYDKQGVFTSLFYENLKSK